MVSSILWASRSVSKRPSVKSVELASKARKVGQVIWVGMISAGAIMCANQGFRDGAWLLIPGMILYLDSSIGAWLYDEQVDSVSFTPPGRIGPDLGVNRRAKAH